MQRAVDGDGRNGTALRGCAQLYVLLYGAPGSTGSYREMETLFEFSGSQLLTALWREDKTHFRKIAFMHTYGHRAVLTLKQPWAQETAQVKGPLDLITAGLQGTSDKESTEGFLVTCPSTKSGACPLNASRAVPISGISALIKYPIKEKNSKIKKNRQRRCWAKAMPHPCCWSPAFLLSL